MADTNMHERHQTVSPLHRSVCVTMESNIYETEYSQSRFSNGSPPRGGGSSTSWLQWASLVVGIVTLLVVLGFFIGDTVNSYGTLNTKCTDYNACTKDVSLNDGTCEHRQYPIGKTCGSACLKADASGMCDYMGLCVAPPSTCGGTCSSITYNETAGQIECPIIQYRDIETREVRNATVGCAAKSCLYFFDTNEYSRNCADYIVNGKDLLRDECLSVSYLTEIETCAIIYNCVFNANADSINTTFVEQAIAARTFHPLSTKLVSSKDSLFALEKNPDALAAYSVLVSDAIARTRPTMTASVAHVTEPVIAVTTPAVTKPIDTVVEVKTAEPSVDTNDEVSVAQLMERIRQKQKESQARS